MHHGGTCRRLSLKTCTSSLNVKLTNDCVFLMAMTIQSSVSRPKLKLDTESIITQVNVHDHFSHLQNIRTSEHDKPKHVLSSQQMIAMHKHGSPRCLVDMNTQHQPFIE